MISVRFQGKPFSITVIQIYALNTNAEEAEVEWFSEDLPDLLTLTHKKRCPFHHRELECKSRKSRDTWSNRQAWPWRTKWSWAKSNKFLPRECIGHSKHSLSTTQETTLYMDITRSSILKSDSLYTLQLKMEKLYTSPKTRPGADYGSDHELLIARFRLKLKQVGKTTRPFRYELAVIQCKWQINSRDKIW